jgi:hypothetical protein
MRRDKPPVSEAEDQERVCVQTTFILSNSFRTTVHPQTCLFDLNSCLKTAKGCEGYFSLDHFFWGIFQVVRDVELGCSRCSEKVEHFW